MARTRKQAEEEFARRVYEIFLGYEQTIDNILVEKLELFRRHGKYIIFQTDIDKSGGFCNSTNKRTFPLEYQEALITLIKEKYSDWKVTYKDNTRGFVFHYTPSEPNTSLFHNIEERFEAMEIEKEEEDEYEDDIPF